MRVKRGAPRETSDRRQRSQRGLNQVLIASIDRARIARASKKRAHEDAVRGRSAGPFRRAPGCRHDGQALGARDDEPGACQRGADGWPIECKRDDCAGAVRNAAAQRGKRGVELLEHLLRGPPAPQ